MFPSSLQQIATIESNLDRARFPSLFSITDSPNEEQDRLENQWLRHPTLGTLITQTFHWGSLCMQAMQMEMKARLSLYSDMDYRAQTISCFSALATGAHFLNYAEKFTAKLIKLLKILIKPAENQTQFTSQDLLELLNLQLKNDDGDLIVGTKLISWLNHTLFASLFLQVLEAFTLTETQKIELLVQCINTYYCKNSLRYDQLVYQFPFANLAASPLIQNELFKLLEENRIQIEDLSSSVSEETSSSSSSVVDNITFDSSLIKAYETHLNNKEKELRQKELQQKKPINTFDELMAVAKKEFKVENISATQVRNILWRQPLADAIIILETALKNPRTDPFAKFMSGATGDILSDRLILDYMLALSVKPTRNHTMMDYANAFKVNCFDNPAPTFQYILGEFTESQLKDVAEKKTQIKDIMLAWLLPIRAIGLDAAADPTTAVGQGMKKSQKEGRIFTKKSTANQGRYGKVCEAAAAAKQKIMAEFLNHIADKPEFEKIRTLLQPAIITNAGAQTQFGSSAGKEILEEGQEMKSITKKNSPTASDAKS